jgi:hypothetical protein
MPKEPIITKRVCSLNGLSDERKISFKSNCRKNGSIYKPQGSDCLSEKKRRETLLGKIR